MNVLIIGKESYIGTHIRDCLRQYGHMVAEFDAEHKDITELELNGYDSVIHVAAIVHKKDIKNYEPYKKVNVDLPIKVASLAKNSGVKQFVFLSSMAVYGCEKSLKGCIINNKTEIAPTTNYGKSKWEAEQKLLALEDEGFNISVIRPANVYGKNCPGGYMNKFRKITEKLPFIPVAYESIGQGMIYVENLCELIQLVVKNRASGIFPAQDKAPVSAVQMMECISKCVGIKRKKSRLGGLIFKIVRVSLVRKLYGGVSYDVEYANTDLGDYCKVSFEQGIKYTFGG